MITRDGMMVCSDGAFEQANALMYLGAAGPIDGKSIAWIGGGYCVGPRLFALHDCKQTVYEIEPSLDQFCPQSVAFVSGDWRNTLTGTYGVIIYDLGGEVPRELLSKFLSHDGVILPETK